MNCVDWQERIALDAGGDLGPAEAAEVERHLAACGECREFWSGLRDTMADLREAHAGEIAPLHFTAVRTGVLAEIERGRRVWRRLAWVSGVGIAAALVLGLAIRPRPLPAPPPRVAFRIPPVPPVPVVRARETVAAKARVARRPVLVKLQTGDPKIVIYWIAD
jgi:hypothetical protein